MGRDDDRSGSWSGAARAASALALVLALSACAPAGTGTPATGDGGLELRFEDRSAPGAFRLEAPAVRDGPDGAAGLWAAVPGLRRPERAEALNLGTGRSVKVALYRASRPSPAIRLSGEAADALGVGTAPVKVRITALRRQAVVDTR